MRIELDRLSLIRPGGARPLADLTLEIPAGQFCAILGRSGAGKSSLLRVLGGMTAPSGGEARVGGVPLSPVMPRALRRRIGQIHQDGALVPEASCAQNVVAGAAAAMPVWRTLTGLYPQWTRERAVALHQALGLDPATLGVPLHRLSGGQQQRIGVARALMPDPALVLADEPVASVDPETAHRVLRVLAAHRERIGATVLCALHQPDLACAFADRIVVIDAGRVAFDGSPAEYRRAGRRLEAVA